MQCFISFPEFFVFILTIISSCFQVQKTGPQPGGLNPSRENQLMICVQQRWSRGHKARGQGQGHKKNPRPRPRTAFPRTVTLEAKDRNARGQGQGPRTQAQVLSKKKKRFSQKFFRRSPKKKRSSQKFFRRSPQKNVFQKIFQALHKILTIQKIALSSSRGQANFRGLEASRPRPRT